MTPLFAIALTNVLMAGALAVPAGLVARWGRRPALTHGLWLLVLLKLVTPPLVAIPVFAPEPEAPPAPEVPADPPAPPPAADAVPLEDVPPFPLPDVIPPPPDVAPPAPEAPAAPGTPADAAPPPAPPAPPARAVPQAAPAPSVDWRDALTLVWLGGSALWLAAVLLRLRRFGQLLRHARPAPEAIQAEARTVARALGVRSPPVLLLPAAVSPMLWSIGRAPRLLLPAGLLERLAPGQLATLLAHELAHWRRGDHRVRWLEAVALALYWWCPLAWWARRQLQQAEEECCDAWVVAVLPGSARAYALALVETIDFLSGAPAALPPVASGVGHVRLLKRRLTMILRGTTPRSLTRAGLLGLAGLAVLLLPFAPGAAQQPAKKPPQALDVEVGIAAGDPKAKAEQERAIEKLQLLQKDLDRTQAELQKQLAEREKRVAELMDAIRALKMQADIAARKAHAGQAPVPVPPLPKVAVKPPFPPAGVPMPNPDARKRGDVEQRLEQIERKLDALLWEVTALRRDLPRPHPAPTATPGGAMMPPGAGWKAAPKGPPGYPGAPGHPGTPAVPPGALPPGANFPAAPAPGAAPAFVPPTPPTPPTPPAAPSVPPPPPAPTKV